MRPRLTYANVMATIAVFIALGGASYAALKLPKNSVGSSQIKKNAVVAAKIKKGAVTGDKIANGSITGAKIEAGSLTGADLANGSVTGTSINQSTLNAVRASNVYGVSLNPDCTAAAPFPSGVSATTVGTSGCKVTFPVSVINCAATATAGLRTSAILIIAEVRTVETFRNPNIPNEIKTFPAGEGAKKPEPVDLTVVC
jgi:hypothetical protein